MVPKIYRDLSALACWANNVCQFHLSLCLFIFAKKETSENIFIAEYMLNKRLIHVFVNSSNILRRFESVLFMFSIDVC